jgi:hypothetical protein
MTVFRPDVAYALIVSLMLVGAGAASAAPQQGGAVAQPPSTNNATSGDPQGDLKAAINSPDARTVAALRCSSEHKGCPLTDAAATDLARQFDNALLTGSDMPTPLVLSLQKLLSGNYDGDAVWPSNAAYVVVHLVRFAADGESHRDRWLLFRRNKGRITASSGTRILGAKQVAVVFIHLGAEVQLARIDAAGTRTPVAADLAASESYSNVEYRAIAKRKVPVNIQHLIALLRVATKAQAEAAIPTKKVGLLGFGLYADVPVPSDLTVFGARFGNVPTGFGKPITYDNEGKYLWDVSVAAPVNKISLLTYDETGDTFTPKVLNKQSIYGTLNVYPFPVDLKEGNLRWIRPRAMVGSGLTGRPGDNFLLAGAFGIKEIQIFVGSGFVNQRILKPGTDPADGANYTERYASRLTYGINVPVLSALKSLTDAKSKERAGHAT